MARSYVPALDGTAPDTAGEAAGSGDRLDVRRKGGADVMRPRGIGVLVVVGLAALVMMTGTHAGEPPRRFHIEKRAVGTLPIAERFDANQIAILEKLNRADAQHLDRLIELVVPEWWSLDERAYTSLPAWYEPASSYPKLVVVYVPGQVFGAYEAGRLARWGPVSTGARASATPEGWFHLTWRAPRHVSTVDSDWDMKWYFNFENVTGLALHEYVLPGHPASHGCVRLLERDAKWLYEWGEPWVLDRTGQVVIATGTPVLVTGAYDFESPPPWRSLTWLSAFIELPRVLPPELPPELP
jgi:hypothetical protein